MLVTAFFHKPIHSDLGSAGVVVQVFIHSLKLHGNCISLAFRFAKKKLSRADGAVGLYSWDR